MGCDWSMPARVSPARRRPIQASKSNLTKNLPENLSSGIEVLDDEDNDGKDPKILSDLYNCLHESVRFIVKGISNVPKPINLRPIVCLNECTAPIAISIVSLSSGNSTEIYMPVAGISIYNKKRFLLVGQIELLSLCVQTNTEASAFIENSVRWVGYTRNNYRILLLEIPTAIANQISDNLKVFGFIVSIEDSLPEGQKGEELKFHIVITTMKTKYVDQLRAFPGGLIIGAPSSSLSISVEGNNNPFAEFNPRMVEYMLEVGFGFPKFSLEIGNMTSEYIKINKSFKELHQNTLLSLIRNYSAMIKSGNDILVPAYDNLVTALRYHIIVLPRKYYPCIYRLAKYAFGLLEDTHYEIDQSSDTEFDDDPSESLDIFHCNYEIGRIKKLICPSLIHCITAVLLSEILQRFPARVFVGVHFDKYFPGEIDEDLAKFNLGDYRTHHEFSCDSWNSTGLYLASGTMAFATISKSDLMTIEKHGKIKIQIGSHTVCNISQQGPWKRWPIIYVTYDFPSVDTTISATRNGNVSPDEDLFIINGDEVTIPICSPFGGIVYVVMEEFTHTKIIELDLTFRNMLQYPIFCSSEPSIYYEFMEILTKNQNLNEEDGRKLTKKKRLSNATSSSSQILISMSNMDAHVPTEAERGVLCPWTEIETPFLDITVPSEKISIFGNLVEYSQYLEEILSELLRFTVDESLSPYRLVFDIELPDDEPTCEYPITMSFKMLPSIATHSPSTELCILLYHIATLSLEQIGFGKDDSMTVAMVAAAHTIKVIFGKMIDPVQFLPEDKSQLFNDLWEIYLDKGSDLYVQTLSHLRKLFTDSTPSEKKVWESFANRLSANAGAQYNARLISKKNEFATGLVYTQSSRSLMEFQLPDTNLDKVVPILPVYEDDDE